MSVWPLATLGDVVDVVPGFASGADLDNGVFQIRMNNVSVDGRLDLSKRRRIPADTRNLDRFLLRRGDVLFNATNSPELVGKTAFFPGLDEPTVFSNHFLRLRSRIARLNTRYLARWLTLQFQQRVFASMARQWVNQATVSRESLLAMSFPLPAPRDQHRVVDILDKADTLRAKRRAALARLDTLVESSFLDMFGDPATNSRQWPELANLGEVADIASGITKGRSLNGAQARSVPYLAVANVQARRLDLRVVKTIDATEAEIARYSLRRNDLLLTEGGDPDKLGRGTLWAEELPECIHQNHIFRVRLTSGEIHPLFLNWLVGSSRGKQYFLRSAKQTTGIASINMTQLRGFPLIVPPFELQARFASIVGVVEEQKAMQLQSLVSLNALFASLQHRAFRGEL